MNASAKMMGLDQSHESGELQRFTVQERLLWQCNGYRFRCEKKEHDAMMADHDALMLEYLGFMKFRRHRATDSHRAFLQVIDWWPIAADDDFDDVMDAVQCRFAQLMAFLAAGGGEFVVEQMFDAIGKHIQKAAVADNKRKLRAASTALRFLTRNFVAALAGCMAERSKDGGGFYLAKWAQARAERHRLEKESWENRNKKPAPARQPKRKAAPAAARNKSVGSRRQQRPAVVNPQA